MIVCSAWTVYSAKNVPDSLVQMPANENLSSLGCGVVFQAPKPNMTPTYWILNITRYAKQSRSSRFKCYGSIHSLAHPYTSVGIFVVFYKQFRLSRIATFLDNEMDPRHKKGPTLQRSDFKSHGELIRKRARQARSDLACNCPSWTEQEMQIPSCPLAVGQCSLTLSWSSLNVCHERGTPPLRKFLIRHFLFQIKHLGWETRKKFWRK